MASESVPAENQGLTEARLRTAVQVAGELGTGVPISELNDLLPSRAVAGDSTVGDWLRSHPGEGQVHEGTVYARHPSPGFPSLAERRQRGESYLLQARGLLEQDLRPTHPYLRCVGVTGSVAYGEPEEGDDCDFFVVTRDGSLWVFLAALYLTLRMRSRAGAPDRPAEWCFNYVVDEREAFQLFAQPQGFLFARETLMMRPLLGAPFYHRLLASAPWLEEEAPRLFARRQDEQSARADISPGPVSLGVRALNFVAFLGLATYLHLANLVRNHRLRRTGRADESFRTVTRRDRLSVLSTRFDRLTDRYRESTKVTRRSSPSARDLPD